MLPVRRECSAAMQEESVLVFSAVDYYQAQLARAALESAGLDVVVSGETLQPGMVGGVPFIEAAVQLRVRPDDVVRAREVLDDALAEPPMHGPWRCPRCNAQVEGVFDRCWRCGSDDPRAVADEDETDVEDVD